MKKINQIQIIFLLLNIVFCYKSFSQEKYDSDSLVNIIKSLPSKDICPECKPILYGSKDDNYPDEIKIIGRVVNISPALIQCGVICNSGTMEIKLSKKISSYPDDTIYLTILCFVVKEEDYLNKTIEVIAKKLYRNAEDCYVKAFNKIDSKGIPFYSLDSQEEIKIN